MKHQNSQKCSLTQKAYEQIKHMILHLEIKPGERIQEEKFAGFIDGSRTPVREALRKLSDEGLVNIYPRRFSEVAYYDEEAVKQIGAVRLSQDILACHLAIRNGSDADFTYLLELAKKCDTGAKAGNIYERISFDTMFHLQIAKIGKNNYLINNQTKLYLLIHLIQISKYAGVEESMMQIMHHEKMVNAFYKRDSKLVKRIVCEHLQEFYNIDQELVDMYLG